MARQLHKRNCGSAWVSILFKLNVCLHDLTPALAEMLPKMDRWKWKFDSNLPKIIEPDEVVAFNPLTGYILRKIFGEAGVFKARTFKHMCDIIDSTFPAVGDLPATPYISRATIAYVHAIILHTPYYSREDKNIKGKVEDYYQKEVEGMMELEDADFNNGLREMFKHHYNWLVKDVGAGYDPDADMYAESPGPTPPGSPKAKPAPRPKVQPEPAPAGAAGAAYAGKAGITPAAGGYAGGAEKKSSMTIPLVGAALLALKFL